MPIFKISGTKLEKLMIDKLGKDKADKIKLDWHNPRVICVAENYRALL